SEIGLLKKQEHEVVRNVFRLDDRSVDSMMTPRNEIVYIDINEPLEENLKKIVESDHSRFPVCRGGMHDILGVIATKKLLRRHLKDELKNITNDLQPAVFVPETLNGIKIMEQFRESGVQMIFVVDEYGGISGIITLQDLLEAMTGEFRPNDPRQMWAVQRKDGSWLLDGMIPIQELVDKLKLQNVPGDRKENFNTLSGMMMWLIGRIPNTGDITEWEDWQFEVVDLDGNRVDKVLASKISKSDQENKNETLNS
uniref:hemolysin family protein n=1 Tax=Flexistipes sinusarabici TaxID=2352 RepID=UPI002352B364